jgi:hypothetical protein
VTITLTEDDQALAQEVARSRYEANRKQGVKDRKVGPQSNEVTDLEGVASEIALARLLGASPDTSTDKRPHFDLVLDSMAGPITVDVKATRHEKGKLLAVPGKAAKRPMAYALLIGTFPTYRLAGFAPANELLQQSRLGSLGYGLTFIMPQEDLVTFERLERILMTT